MVDLYRLDLPRHVFDLAGVVVFAADSQRIVARVGLLRGIHAEIITFDKRFLAELDRDLRGLCFAVVGQIFNCHCRALEANRRDGDSELTALFIAVLRGNQVKVMLTGIEIGRQLIGIAGRTFDFRHRTAAYVPLAADRFILLGGRHDRCPQRHIRRLPIFHRHAWIRRRDAPDGHWQYADSAHRLIRFGGPCAVRFPECIAVL